MLYLLVLVRLWQPLAQGIPGLVPLLQGSALRLTRANREVKWHWQWNRSSPSGTATRMQSSAALLNNAVGVQSTTTAALLRREHPNESSKADNRRRERKQRSSEPGAPPAGVPAVVGGRAVLRSLTTHAEEKIKPRERSKGLQTEVEKSKVEVVLLRCYAATDT
ncbi:hypothetical protein B0H14DRAFT_2568929 [Mycena olivaceomarginata]|nr:hypothetical protein B0H14DRAFT_2568929 [Mycena olivaceomarginata]